MSYPCTNCGACCRHIGDAKQILNTKPEYAFPYSWDESGKCEMLGDDNKCKVYDTRPTICDIDKMNKFYKMSKKQFYKMNVKACHVLMKMEGIYEQYRIEKL